MSELDDTIQYFTGKKQFLGGYKNKFTGQIYHHAKVQTPSLSSSVFKKKIYVEKFHRDTQTITTRDIYQQTPYNASTQCAKSGIYISEANDKILLPRNQYVYTDSIQANTIQAVLIIQKYCKRWLAKQELYRRKQKFLARILWDKEQNRVKILEESDWLKEITWRKRNPSTKADFELLFHDIQEWWMQQVEDLKKSQSGAVLKASLYVVLDKEVKKIEDLTKKWQAVRALNAFKKQNAILSKAAEPKTWKAYKTYVEVHTEGTQVAKIFRNLYKTVSTLSLTPKDRISLLVDLKTAISPYKCTLVSDLKVLADREIDLLLRGIKEENLQGLRTRINNTLWQIVRQPAFNTEMGNLSKLSSVNGLKPHIIVCSSCNQYYILPPNTLDEVVGKNLLQGRFSKCKNCRYLENEGWIRKGIEFHKRILKLLLEEEDKLKSTSGIIHLLQPTDVVYLVDKIWKGQSSLSGVLTLKDLELVRWNIHKNWTPWNCLLVTRQEAIRHRHIEDHMDMYDKKFIQSVYLKHLKARAHFSTIPRFLPYLKLKFSSADYNVEQ